MGAPATSLDVRMVGYAFAGMVVAGFVFLRWVPVSGARIWIGSIAGALLALLVVLARFMPEGHKSVTGLLIATAVAGGVWTAIVLRILNAGLDFAEPVYKAASVTRFVDVRNPSVVLGLGPKQSVEIYIGRTLQGRIRRLGGFEIPVRPGLIEPYVIRGEVIEAIEKKLAAR